MGAPFDCLGFKMPAQNYLHSSPAGMAYFLRWLYQDSGLWLFGATFPNGYLPRGGIMDLQVCAMCSSIGWVGVALSGILIVALIAALIALTVFLFKRSHLGSRP